MQTAKNTVKYKVQVPGGSIDDNYPCTYLELIEDIRNSALGEKILNDCYEESEEKVTEWAITNWFNLYAIEDAREAGWVIEEVTALDHAIELLKAAANELTCHGVKTHDIDSFIREVEHASK